MENIANIESTEIMPRSLELARELEKIGDEEDEEIVRSKLREFILSLKDDLNVDYIDNANELYKKMRDENCLVRVEKLSRVLETLKLDSPMHIADEDEYHYANATLPVPEGIKIAFAEGQAPGPVRIAVAFGKTLVGFKTENIKVEEIDFADRPDAEERKYLCRHVVGDLNKGDIISVVIRIPRHLMEDDLLSDKEIKGNSQFVIRGFNTNNQ